MFQDILTQLPSLTRQQLEEVRKRAAFILQNKATNGTSTISDEDWLLEGILTELDRLGISNRKTSNFRIKNSTSFASYETRASEVRELLMQAAPGLSAAEHHALGQISARELARYLKTDISLNKMLSMVGMVPQALNRAFPGYMEGRMLSVVIRKKAP